jgi:hypothetical protein
MARSSHGSRPASDWADTQRTAPRARVVRLGRPANDNAVATPLLVRLVGVAAVAALAVFALRWLGIF